MDTPFWRAVPLKEIQPTQWESLCDGCGRCCMVKLGGRNGQVRYTDIPCSLLDCEAIRCRSYESRSDTVTNCVTLTPQTVREADWLPETCAYRIVDAGRDLEWWHPLVSGSADTVRQAGISVRGNTSGASMRDGWS